MSSREPGKKHPYARAHENAAAERADRTFVPPFRAPSEQNAQSGRRPDDEDAEVPIAPGDDPDTPRVVGNGRGYGITRAALILVALALGVGLLVGRVSVKTDSGAAVQPTPSPTGSQQVVPLGPTSLQETGALCSLQRGKNLTLGVEVRNVSTVPAQLRRLKVSLPAKGLTLEATGVGACGEIDVPRLDEFGLPTQGTVWLSTTVRVNVTCPAALPVSMTIYAADLTGKVEAIKVPGFKNLKAATWSGCTSGAASSGTGATKTGAAKTNAKTAKKSGARTSAAKKAAATSRAKRTTR